MTNTAEIKQHTSLNEAIQDLFGTSVSVTAERPVSGGDINQASELRLSDGRCVFMKANALKRLSFFITEAHGLMAIRETGTVQTPEIYTLGTDAMRGCSFLLMEYICPEMRRPDRWKIFGRELAAMHRAPTDSIIGKGRFGFPEDNYIGATPQSNKVSESWVSFFRAERLEKQFRMAEAYFGRTERRTFLSVLDHLDEYLVEPEHPSLIHGDLWAGNVMTGNDGKIWLIDPAAYVGCAEADLAMTELFGGFPETFYRSYKESAETCPGYTDRRDLYNLYHLLNHLNLFGGGYYNSVMSIVNRYGKL